MILCLPFDLSFALYILRSRVVNLSGFLSTVNLDKTSPQLRQRIITLTTMAELETLMEEFVQYVASLHNEKHTNASILLNIMA